MRHTCCFLGHREICETQELRTALYQIIEKLITEGVDTFLFGSKSQFDSLCYDLVTELRAIYPAIKRIYVRAEFPVIGEDYYKYLLENYEESYYPESVLGAGRAVYIKRNYALIDCSQFCVFYYDHSYTPKGRNSGTAVAYAYAIKQRRIIYNIFSQEQRQKSRKEV